MSIRNIAVFVSFSLVFHVCRLYTYLKHLWWGPAKAHCIFHHPPPPAARLTSWSALQPSGGNGSVSGSGRERGGHGKGRAATGLQHCAAQHSTAAPWHARVRARKP